MRVLDGTIHSEIYRVTERKFELFAEPEVGFKVIGNRRLEFNKNVDVAGLGVEGLSQ